MAGRSGGKCRPLKTQESRRTNRAPPCAGRDARASQARLWRVLCGAFVFARAQAVRARLAQRPARAPAGTEGSMRRRWASDLPLLSEKGEDGKPVPVPVGTHRTSIASDMPPASWAIPAASPSKRSHGRSATSRASSHRLAMHRRSGPPSAPLAARARRDAEYGAPWKRQTEPGRIRTQPLRGRSPVSVCKANRAN